jgi:hypothetical protein
MPVFEEGLFIHSPVFCKTGNSLPLTIHLLYRKRITIVSKADNAFFMLFYKLLKISVVCFGMALNNETIEKYVSK